MLVMKRELPGHRSLSAGIAHDSTHQETDIAGIATKVEDLIRNSTFVARALNGENPLKARVSGDLVIQEI